MAKRAGLEGYGLEIVERVPLATTPTKENLRYLTTKRDRMGHVLDLPGALDEPTEASAAPIDETLPTAEGAT